MTQEWSQPQAVGIQERVVPTEGHRKAPMRTALGNGGIWTENRKRGRLLWAEGQKEHTHKDGLVGWQPWKTVSYLNLTSLWRGDKARKGGFQQYTADTARRTQNQGRDSAPVELLEARSSEGETRTLYSPASRIHWAHSLLGAVRLTVPSAWSILPSPLPFPPTESSSFFKSEYYCHFLKEVSLTFQFKLDFPAIVSHLIQLFSFIALIMASNDIFMSVTICSPALPSDYISSMRSGTWSYCLLVHPQWLTGQKLSVSVGWVISEWMRDSEEKKSNM